MPAMNNNYVNMLVVPKFVEGTGICSSKCRNSVMDRKALKRNRSLLTCTHIHTNTL